MPKINRKKDRQYTLGETTVSVKTISGKEMIEYFEQFSDDQNEPTKLFDLFLELIVKYTDLEHTREELEEMLTLDEVFNLGQFVLNVDSFNPKNLSLGLQTQASTINSESTVSVEKR